MKKYPKGYLTSLVAIMSLLSMVSCKDNNPIYKTNQYTWYNDHIEQGPYTATALSDTSIMSDYHSLADGILNRQIEFKFSINGRDNELKSGINHQFICETPDCHTPIIQFGIQNIAQTDDRLARQPMDSNTRLTVKVDLTPIFRSFDSIGSYTTPTGYVVNQSNFKGIWISGGFEPLQWDFDNLMSRDDLKLHDPDGDNIYEITLLLNKPRPHTPRTWHLKHDIDQYPQYTAPTILEQAIYNMTLDEMVSAIETDRTLRTGALWDGVWTRDVSYSIIMSMAYMLPEESKNSLLHKVNSRMRIIQDTGTGGAWPCSTDRTIWCIAAWELYLATGDKEWIDIIYPIVRNTLDDDRKVAYNHEYGLMMGETSFIDWRDQSYPKWMEPIDIAQSICLGTNAVHYRALSVASSMARLQGDTMSAQKYTRWADSIKTNINKHLYNPKTKSYDTYLYGKNYYQRESRSESLGQALVILWDIAPHDKLQTISKNIPFTPYGAPIFYPYIQEMPSYHNNAVWPFVSAYMALAYAKTLNMEGLLSSFASIYRPAALFCTNKENFDATTGDDSLTQLNSDNQLWSLAGNIGVTHRILFGIDCREDGIRFTPTVPRGMSGRRNLKNFRYRNAKLDITVDGYGSKIETFTIDGKPSQQHTIPSTIQGNHTIYIKLQPSNDEISKINTVDNIFSPRQISDITLTDDTLSWACDSEVKEYTIYYNGIEHTRIPTKKNDKIITHIIDPEFNGEVQVRAFIRHRGQSFASKPIRHYTHETTIELENYAPSNTIIQSDGYMGKGYVELNGITKNNQINIPVNIDIEGQYALDIRYANGCGPINTDNKCALRALYLDRHYLGSIIMPQRGTDQWSDWGWTNAVKVHLTPGKHTITIGYRDFNVNMNIHTNKAHIDQIRITKL